MTAEEETFRLLFVAAWILGQNTQPKVRDERQLHSSPCYCLLRATRGPQAFGPRCSPAKPSSGLAGGLELLWWDRLCVRDAQSWLVPGRSLLPPVTSRFPLAAADSMVSPGSHKTLERDGSCLASFSSGWSLCTKKSLSSAVKWVTRVFLSPAHIAAGAPVCVVTLRWR